jgi:hypothetical protein
MSTNLGKEVLTSLKNPQKIAQEKHSQDTHCKNTIHALHSTTHTNLKKNFEKTITTSNHH